MRDKRVYYLLQIKISDQAEQLGRFIVTYRRVIARTTYRRKLADGPSLWNLI